ncbi:MAG: hypothetical protein DLM73_03480 [Chthoniobacterales bacterium]|nr:MAG: hypothetical protein DLM73_03480 [Chthoniobacterales bacterium]
MFVEGGLHPEQIKALRHLSLQRKLELALAGIESVVELRKAMIRAEHPGWSGDRAAKALREETRNAGR